MTRLLRAAAIAFAAVLAYLLGSRFLDPSPWKTPEAMPTIVCRPFVLEVDGRDCHMAWCEQAVGSADRGGPATLWCADGGVK